MEPHSSLEIQHTTTTTTTHSGGGDRCLEEVDIQLLPGSDLLALASTVRTMHLLQSVDVSCLNSRETQLEWNLDTVSVLFEAIGSLPRLQKLQFKFLGGGDFDNGVPLRLFTCLLNQSACQLQSLRLALVGPISCDIQDMEEFSRAIRRQLHLQDFRLISSYLAHEALISSCSMDPVVKALASLPSLEFVSLKAANKGHLGILQPDSVGALCQSTCIKDIILDNFVLHNHHMATVSRALVGHVLPQQQQHQLESLYLNLTGEMNMDCTMLPKMLQENKILQKLQLRLSNQTNISDFLLHTAHALRYYNTTLNELGIFGALKINDKVEPAFVDMLGSNCSLTTLVIPSTHTDGWRDKIDFLLTLNVRGRQRLLRESESVSQQEWIEMFTSALNDINFVYYYMRINPLRFQKLAVLD